MEAESFHAGRRTGGTNMTNLPVVCHNYFAKASGNGGYNHFKSLQHIHYIKLKYANVCLAYQMILETFEQQEQGWISQRSNVRANVVTFPAQHRF